MVNLLDRELVAIGKVSHEVAVRFSKRTWTSQQTLLALMDELEKYAVDAFQKIGFHVQVDPTPMIANMPPNISIMDRIEQSEFDYDEKKWEVNKAIARSERIHNEDQNPIGKTVTGE